MNCYEFSNRDYVLSHGKAPRGAGHWAFTLKNTVVEGIAPETPDTFIEQVSPTRMDTTFWIPGVWTLSEAKRRASVFLAAHAVPAGTTVYVAP